ncbi:FecR family protein [Bordetella genomosp. 13]|uniref:FecR family protein n=1 Tax=Bordetella genomosp. 13 TaxID=463040 RepID=UPI001E57B409|nr:DUF4880 domain-containing protein [Bordetella genomosp. 13]
MESASDAVSAALDAEARAWVRLLATGRPDSDDAQAFRQWHACSAAHARAWTRACREWDDVGQVAHAFRARHGHASAAAAWPPRSSGRRWFLGAAASAVAASAAVAVVRPPFGLWPSWSELGADYRTATGEQRDIALEGEVSLALNTQTSVAVASLDGMPRIELIAGEAAVRNPGLRPLEVVAGPGRIRLADGGVEVRRLAAGDMRVRCTAGGAQLWHPLRTVALREHDEIAYDMRSIGTPTRRTAAAGSAWRQGMVVFEDTPLSAAVQEINRYRPGRVVLLDDELGRRRLSGRFRIDALDQAIEQLQQLYGAQVQRVGQVVLLS